MIIDELRDYLGPLNTDRRVDEVCVGTCYTAVMLDDGRVGLAYTFRRKGSTDVPSLKSGRSPLARPAAEVLAYLASDDGLERSMGLAAVNALANRRGAGQHEADILHVLSAGFMDRVGMVGYFAPLVPSLERRVRELVVFERDSSRPDRTRPAEDAYVELPRCDVAIITATALIFGDIDRLLEAAGGCREVALVGASTPLVPEVFASHGVTLLSGVTVNDGSALFQVVGDGGGARDFTGYVRKVNVRPPVVVG